MVAILSRTEVTEVFVSEYSRKFSSAGIFTRRNFHPQEFSSAGIFTRRNFHPHDHLPHTTLHQKPASAEMDRDLRQQQRENLKLREEVENEKDEVAKLRKKVQEMEMKGKLMEMKSKLDRSIIAGIEEDVQLQGKIIDAVKETDKLDRVEQNQNPSLGKKRKIITL